MVEAYLGSRKRRTPGGTPGTGILGSPRWVTQTSNSPNGGNFGDFLRRIAIRSSIICRSRRGRMFLDRLRPTASDEILDLGGGRGGYMAGLLPFRANVTIADVDAEMLRTAAESHGFGTVQLDGSERFPITDQRFDVVFCSSVIEHVTGPKEVVFGLTDGATFEASARAAQANFAAELRRVAKRYFVQTPYKYFPVESHSFLPFFIVLLPRRWQVKLLSFFGRHWIKAVQPDFRLLTIKEMRALFPDAEIVLERYCGFVKSIVAIKA
jgi:cyclopropane fatty-acyl-phospholipid synthase-like methyltransferase